MKQVIVLGLVCVLAGCGGGGKRDYARTPALSGSAKGPIASACMASDRKARSPQLCGCIQQVANQSLSSNDQRRGAQFFRDPQKAQDTRQSNSSSNEAFWKRWKQFGETSAARCS